MQSLVAMPIGLTKQVSQAFFPFPPTQMRITHNCVILGCRLPPLPFHVTDPVPVLFPVLHVGARSLSIRLPHTDGRYTLHASTLVKVNIYLADLITHTDVAAVDESI